MDSPQLNGLARGFFDAWFTALASASKGLDDLPRVHDKRLSILTLGKLMEMEPANVPVSLQPGWAGIVAGALSVFKELPAALQSTFSFVLFHVGA